MNFPFFLNICLNFLDMRATSLFVDLLELVRTSRFNSFFYTFNAFEETSFSFLLEPVSLVLRATNSIFGIWFCSWIHISWTHGAPSSSSKVKVFVLCVPWIVVVLGSHTLGSYLGSSRFCERSWWSSHSIWTRLQLFWV